MYPGRPEAAGHLLSGDTIMKRFHVHVHVTDFDKSIGFYLKFFAADPVRIESDYAKWTLEDPRVNFAISTRASKPGINHRGFQADDPQEHAAVKARAETAGMAVLDEGKTTCCYARSEKHWITDPQGIAWEQFHTLGNIPVFSEARESQTAAACCVSTTAAPVAPTETSAGCTPATRSEAIDIPMKSAGSC